MKRLILILVVAVLALVGYHFFTGYMKGMGGGAGGGMAMPVSVATAEKRAVVETQEFSGRLKAVSDADIHPQVSGNIEKILFKEGDMVKAGQPLFAIDSRNFRAAALEAQAAYAEAKSSYGRGQILVAEGAISKRDMEARTAAYERANADLTTARVNLDYALIKAPIAGRAGRADVTVGNVVTSGGGAPTLTTIQSIDPIYVDFDIDEQTYLKFIGMGGNGSTSQTQVAVALADNGDAFPLTGVLKSTDNQLDPATGSLRARAELPNPEGKLLPGLFARVRVGSPEPIEAVLVNDNAVGTDQSKRYVYVVGTDNTAHYQEVHLGGMAEGLRIITDGLSGGERIVVNGLMRVQPGAPVAPEMVDMTTLASGTAPVSGSAVSATAPVPATSPTAQQ